jgi:hypothetical protein
LHHLSGGFTDIGIEVDPIGWTGIGLS